MASGPQSVLKLLFHGASQRTLDRCRRAFEPRAVIPIRLESCVFGAGRSRALSPLLRGLVPAAGPGFCAVCHYLFRRGALWLGCRRGVQGRRSWWPVAASPPFGGLLRSRRPVGSASAAALVPSRLSNPAFVRSVPFAVIAVRLCRRVPPGPRLRRRGVSGWVLFERSFSVAGRQSSARSAVGVLTNRFSCQAARCAAGRGLLAAPPSAALCSPRSYHCCCGGASSPAARS